jgi:hypothetical protein
VYRDGPIRDLDERPMAEIADFPVKTPGGPMRFEDFLLSDQSTTMGMVILHEGKVVFETYPRMKPYQKPLYGSVTKIFVSTVLAILEDRGLVDVTKPIEFPPTGGAWVPAIRSGSLIPEVGASSVVIGGAASVTIQ